MLSIRISNASLLMFVQFPISSQFIIVVVHHLEIQMWVSEPCAESLTYTTLYSRTVFTDHCRAVCCFMYRWSLLLSAQCSGVVKDHRKEKNKTKNKGYVGTCVVSPAPTMYILCVWYVGPRCSQHWSTSLPGHSMQHDPSSNQSVIDPVVLLWIPMAHNSTCMSECVCVFCIFLWLGS